MIKRIVTKEQREKKEKRGKIFFGLLIVGLMVLSTLGYAIQSNLGSPSQEESFKYNGFEFTKVNSLWTTGNFAFKYSPKELTENIGSGFKTFENYQGKPAYLQTDDDVAGIELYVNMGQIAERVNYACLSGTKCGEDLPVRTCADNFIIIKEADTNKVRQENNCVYIQGKKEDLVKLTDEFLFKVLKIK